jgi:hypothetical protein
MPDLKPALEAIDTLRKHYGSQPICCGDFLPGHPGDGFMQPPDGPECCQSPDRDVNTLCDVIANVLRDPACNGVSAGLPADGIDVQVAELDGACDYYSEEAADIADNKARRGAPAPQALTDEQIDAFTIQLSPWPTKTEVRACIRAILAAGHAPGEKP